MRERVTGDLALVYCTGWRWVFTSKWDAQTPFLVLFLEPTVSRVLYIIKFEAH